MGWGEQEWAGPGEGVPEILSPGMARPQVPTVPMQSVRLGGGAFGFAFPNNRFILSGRTKRTQTNTGAKSQTEEEEEEPHHLRRRFHFRHVPRRRSEPPLESS